MFMVFWDRFVIFIYWCNCAKDIWELLELCASDWIVWEHLKEIHATMFRDQQSLEDVAVSHCVDFKDNLKGGENFNLAFD